MQEQTANQNLMGYTQMHSPAVRRANAYLNQNGKQISDSRVLVLGIGCGENMRHCHDDPPCTIRSLRDQGAWVDFYDPRISEYECDGMRNRGINRLTPATLGQYDLVVLDRLAPGVDYRYLTRHARCVLDVKCSLRPSLVGENIIHTDLLPS